MRTCPFSVSTLLGLFAVSLAGMSPVTWSQHAASSIDPAITARMASRLPPIGSQLPETLSVHDKTQTLVPIVASDSDPPEFRVDVDNWSADNAIDLEVRYFACDDQDRWCYTVTQRYLLHLQDPQVRGGVYDRSFRMPGQAATGN